MIYQSLFDVIDLFHIIILLSLAARYLARFRVTSQTGANCNITLLNYKVSETTLIRYL